MLHTAPERREVEPLIDHYLEQLADSDEPTERAEIFLNLSDCLERELRQPAGALRAARAALEEIPGSSAALERCADLYERCSQFQDLADFLADQVERARADGVERAPRARRLARLCEEKLADPARAAAAWEEVRRECPADHEALAALSRLLAGAGRLRDRLEILRTLADASESRAERAALHRELARGHADLGSAELAAEHLEWALAHEPGSPADFEELAGHYRALGRTRCAIDALLRGAELRGGRDRADALLAVAAICEVELGDVGQAIDLCLSAEGAAPDHPALLPALCRLYLERDDHEAAVSVLVRGADRATGDERAVLLVRAGDLARKGGDAAAAAGFYRAALEHSEDCAPALRGLASLCRERGELAAAANLLGDAMARAELEEERAEIAFEAGQVLEQLGDRAGAICCYRDALEVGACAAAARRRLAELSWQEGRYAEVVALLEEPIAGTAAPAADDPDQRAAELVRLHRLAVAYRALGLERRALTAVRGARAIAPERRDLLRLHGELSAQLGQHAEACELLGAVLDLAPDAGEEELAPMVRLALSHQAGAAAARAGRTEEAVRRLRGALALDPQHTASLLELLELVRDDARARIDLLRALLAQPGLPGRGQLLTELGDLCRGVGQPDESLAAYREALALSPDDHLLLHKCIEALATGERWEECCELLDRLMTTERDPALRARYAVTAALLCRDELGRPDEAVRLLWLALDTHPDLEKAGAELEAMLRARGDWRALANLYCRLLAHLDGEARAASRSGGARTTIQTRAISEGGAGEQPDGADADRAASLRLWTALGQLCWDRLDQRDDAITAFAVACRLAPDDDEMLRRLAERCEQAGPAHIARAISCQHKLLRRDRRRAATYRALVRLYARAGMQRHAQAVNEALAFVAMSVDPTCLPLPRRGGLAPAGRALTPEMWTSLLHPDEDLLLSAMLALLAPAVAGASAQPHKSAVASLGAEPLPDTAVAARALARVAASLGAARPETLACPEARFPLEVRILADAAGARPVLLVGGPLLQGIGERPLAFHFGRALASLRGGGLLRWLLPQPERLGQLLDAAAALASRHRPDRPGLAATVRSLERTLTPIQREQLSALAQRLATRAVPSDTAARSWLQAHDLSLARVGLVACGDLATAAQILAQDAPSAGHTSPADRQLETAWSSASPEVLAARAHLEQWSDPTPSAEPARSAGAG